MDPVEQGWELLTSGRWEEALRHFDAVLENEPGAPARAHVGRAWALMARGRAEDAFVEFSVAVTLEPRNGFVYHERAIAFTHLGRDEEAVRDLGRALSIKPSAQAFCDRGAVLGRLGHHAEARADLREAISLDPELAAAHLNLGLIVAMTNDRYAAARHLLQAVRLGEERAVAPLRRVRQELFIAATDDGMMRLAVDSVLAATTVDDLADLLERFPFAALPQFTAVLGDVAATLDAANAAALRERMGYLREFGAASDADVLRQDPARNDQAVRRSLGEEVIEAEVLRQEAQSLNDQGVRLSSLGEWVAAEPLLRRASELYIAAGSELDPAHIAVLRNIASVTRRVGDASRVRAAYLSIAEVERKRWRETDPQRADALNEVASALYDAGEDAAAETLVRESLELRRGVLGEEVPDVATSLNNLGHLRWRAGDAASARRLMERAAAIRQEVLPETHLDLANSWTSLGRLALEEDDAEDADRMFTRALEIIRLRLDRNDIRLADAYEDVARAREARDDSHGAALALHRSAEIRRLAGGSAEDLSRCLNNLAQMHYRAGEWDAARDLYAEAVDLLEQALDQNDPLLGDIVNNLANAERARGAWDAARELYERALRIQRHKGDDDEPRVRRVLDDISELRERMAELPTDKLVEQALAYQREGDYSTAERLSRRAVTLLQETADPDVVAVARACQVLGNILVNRADFDGARDAFESGLSAVRSAPHAPYSSVAGLLAGLGNLENAVGHPVAAERWHRESLALLDANGGKRNTTYPKALRNLAIDLVAQADLLGARSLLEEALDLFERQGDAVAVGETLTSLGQLRLRLGELEDAEQLLDRGLSAARIAARSSPLGLAEALSGVADVHRARGRLAMAEVRLREAVDVLGSSLGEIHPRTLGVKRKLAAVLESVGDAKGAEELLVRVLAGQREHLGVHHPEFGTTLVMLGGLYAATDRRPEALPLLTQGAEVLQASLPQQHPSLVAALATVGSFYAAIGAREAARHFLQKALDGALEGHDDPSSTVARITAQLGLLKRADGDLEGAERLLNQALAAYGDRVAASVLADILTQIGSVRAARGKAAAAIDALERAFAVTADAFADVLGLASERVRLAFLTRQQHRLALLLSIVVKNPSTELVERSFEIVLHQKALAADAALAHRDEILSGRHPELIDMLRELGNARTELAHVLLAGASSGETSPGSAVTMLQDRREALERTLAARVPEFAVTRRVHGASKASIVNAMPAGATLVEIVQFSVNDLRPTGAIDPAELIALRRGHEAKMYVAFVLSANPGRPVRLVELGDADTIDELIGGFRRWISRGRRRPDANAPDAGRSLSESGSELRAAVFEPLEQVLGESRQLLIAPDGDLTRLPLEALPDGKGAHLIDRYSITYLSAARDILRFGIKHHRRQSPAVVVADPDFDLRAPHDPSSDFSLLESSDFEFRRLSGTRQEGRLVADVLIDAEELCGHRALESAVKAVRAPKVLHLATHGWFLANRMIDSERVAAEDPLYIHTVHMATIPGFGAYLMDVASAPDPEVELPTHLRRLGANQVNPLLRAGLALAGANTWLRGGHLPTEAEDGLLTAEDVCALDLFGTELVVLSACETGLGEVVSGEGVFGLRRAFVLSGAATLVMSLWKVPDVATASLMADFYRLMQSGVSRGEALRGAQLAMRSRAGYSDPYYWAAFVCQGDPGPISIARSPSAATAT